MMKVALDTDVIIAARRSRSGASHALLRALRAGQIEAVASVPMILEYEAVLMRPEQRQAMGLSLQEVNAFLDSLAALLTPVVPYFLWRPRLRDPDDEMVLEAAVNSGAEAIVTFNKRDFLPGATQFNLAVLTPAEALWQLRRS
jgi:putative PIN family toxin of toxin-antitoxin system